MKDKSLFVTGITFAEEPVKFEQGGSVDFRLWEWHRGDPDSFWMNEQKQLFVSGGCFSAFLSAPYFFSPPHTGGNGYLVTVHKPNKHKNYL